MLPQIIALVISLFALVVSTGLFLSSRQSTWSMRYYERWFQLARLVLERPKILHPLWCGSEQHKNFYGEQSRAEAEPMPEELVFAEMYVDFMLEVYRGGRIFTLLTGRYPGRVPLTNPRTRFLWDRYIRSMYSPRQQRTIDRAVAQRR